MKEKFKSALLALIKDYGLSDKAVNDLVEQATVGLASDATDEVVQAQANLFANIAKAMQGEVTRKVQAAKEVQPKTPQVNEPKGGGGNEPLPNPVLEEFRKQNQLMAEQMKTLQDKIEKQEKAEAKKKTQEEKLHIVKEAAKKVGVSESRLKFIDISEVKTAEDAEKLLSEYRQAEVNDNLPSKGVGGIMGTSDEADKAAAKAWAQSLPDKK